MGNARFSRHSHPVGLAFGFGLMQLACSCQIGLLPGADLRLSGLFAGLAIMVLEFVELEVDFRQTAGVGGNELVDFVLAESATIPGHSGGFCTKVLGGGAVNALGLERTAVDPFRYSSFPQSTVTAGFPHLADSLNFEGAEFPVVEVADFRFREISLGIHGAGRHENMSVDIALVALRVRVVQAYAQGNSVGVAQLQPESAHKLPLRLRIQLVRHGNIHRPTHAGIPTLFGLFHSRRQFVGLHGRADDLPVDDIGFVLGPIVLLASALVGQFAAGVVGDLRDGAVAFGTADRADGQVENRHVSNRDVGLVGKKNRCPARGSVPSPPTAGRTRVAGFSPRCVSALRLSGKASGGSEVSCAWMAGYWCGAATVGASFAAWGNTERKRSASCGDAPVMSRGKSGW